MGSTNRKTGGSGPARPGVSRARRKEARPAELLAAALELFTEKGFAATRLDEVAAQAGVSKGTLYLYFESKEALFRAVVGDIVLPSVDKAEAMLATHAGSAAEQLRDILAYWWQCNSDFRLGALHKLIIAEAGNFPEVARCFSDTIVLRGRQMIRRVLEGGIARGEFRPVALEAAIEVIMAPMLMLVVWNNAPLRSCGTHCPPEHYISIHLDMLLNGLLQTRSFSP